MPNYGEFAVNHSREPWGIQIASQEWRFGWRLQRVAEVPVVARAWRWWK